MDVGMKNEGGISANNTEVSIAAKMTNDEKIQAYIEKLEAENHDLQQKWLSESYEKSILVSENKRLRQIILGNEEEISELKEIIKNLIRPLTEEEKRLTIDVRHKWLEKAKEILEEFGKTEQVR